MTPLGAIKYAFRNGEDDWSVETVKTGTGTDIDGATSIAVDSSGVVHIAYYNAVDGSAVYAFKTGGSWTEEVIDNIGNVGKFISLGLDSTGGCACGHIVTIPI